MPIWLVSFTSVCKHSNYCNKTIRRKKLSTQTNILHLPIYKSCLKKTEMQRKNLKYEIKPELHQCQTRSTNIFPIVTDMFHSQKVKLYRGKYNQRLYWSRMCHPYHNDILVSTGKADTLLSQRFTYQFVFHVLIIHPYLFFFNNS